MECGADDDMSSSVVEDVAPRHPVLPDIGRKVMAKAVVREPDSPNWQAILGRAIQRAVAIVGWSNKEAAAKVGVDDAEFGKWLNASRRPHIDRVIAVDELRGPFFVALAQEVDDVGIVYTGHIQISMKKAG